MSENVSWFSGGVTSAVATKLVLDDDPDLRIIFAETGSHHDDMPRFIDDCERWFDRSIEVHQADGYCDIFDVFMKKRFINSAWGAPCTRILKREVRLRIESESDIESQVFGFDKSNNDQIRAERFAMSYPHTNPRFPLIEHGLSKRDCMSRLSDAGIDLPAMYLIGYANNNCIGCVKGGMGYWNRIRVDFPDVFERMARLERELGHTVLRVAGECMYLDELAPDRGRMSKPLVDSCGMFCSDFEPDAQGITRSIFEDYWGRES